MAIWVTFGLFQSLRDLYSRYIENFVISNINIELCIRVTLVGFNYVFRVKVCKNFAYRDLIEFSTHSRSIAL